MSDDVIGVQVGGAIKNVIALAVGIAYGSGAKENTAAFLITRGLEEMSKIASFFGGKAETVYGLSGLGDMILCSTGSLSKNLKAGRLLGQGRSVQELKDIFGTLPEGLNTIQSLHQIIKKEKLCLPLCSGTYEFVFGGKSLKDFFQTFVSGSCDC